MAMSPAQASCSALSSAAVATASLRPAGGSILKSARARLSRSRRDGSPASFARLASKCRRIAGVSAGQTAVTACTPTIQGSASNGASAAVIPPRPADNKSLSSPAARSSSAGGNRCFLDSSASWSSVSTTAGSTPALAAPRERVVFRAPPAASPSVSSSRGSGKVSSSGEATSSAASSSTASDGRGSAPEGSKASGNSGARSATSGSADNGGGGATASAGGSGSEGWTSSVVTGSGCAGSGVSAGTGGGPDFGSGWRTSASACGSIGVSGKLSTEKIRAWESCYKTIRRNGGGCKQADEGAAGLEIFHQKSLISENSSPSQCVR